MISTIQLRALRTSLHTSPPSTSARLATSFNAPSRRIQPPWAASRFLSTSNSSRQNSNSQPNNPYTNNDSTKNNNSTDLLSAAAANPPPTTRPPPLDLPTRGPDTSTTAHLFATGKAYLTFYKTGLRHIYINTRLVWSLSAAAGIPPDHTPAGDTASPPTKRPALAGGTTRSAELLRRRWRHDVRRLPWFALMLLVCGEFTPLVVLAVPGVVPLTCRIPQQVEKLRRRAEDRRAFSFGRLEGKYGREALCEEVGGGGGVGEVVTPGGGGGRGGQTGGESSALAPVQTEKEHRQVITAHVARSLNLISSLWDSFPLSLLPDTLVGVVAARRVRQHLRYLDRDNHLLHQAGGVAALEEDEVLLACEDRGIWPVGKEEEGGSGSGSGSGLLSSARENLRRWLYLVGDGHGLVAGRDDPWSAERAAEREARMVVLMLRREWPREQTAVRTSAHILQAKGE